MLNAELTPARLAELVEVDVKTVHRWLAEDRVPYPITRHRVARAVEQQETFLWPSLLFEDEDSMCGEITKVWPTRTAISADTWHRFFDQAYQQLDILIYAGHFLDDTLDLADVLRAKAVAGVRIRMLVGDQDSAAVRTRARELGLPSLPAHCHARAESLEALAGAGVLTRRYDTTLYASQFRFDGVLLVNPHTYGLSASQSPVERLHAGGEALFRFYADAFDRIWAKSPMSRSFDR